MTLDESEIYYNKVAQAGLAWAMGKCEICNQEELSIIADRYEFRLPFHFRHFLYSENPNSVCATGAHKSILRDLKRLQTKILKVHKKQE